MRKFESDRAKSEKVIAKKRGLTGSEIHSKLTKAPTGAGTGTVGVFTLPLAGGRPPVGLSVATVSSSPSGGTQRSVQPSLQH